MMETFLFYLTQAILPSCLMLFSIYSFIAYRRHRKKAALFMGIGFTMGLIGYVLMNVGPSSLAINANGATTGHTPFFFAGMLISRSGILLAAISFARFVSA